MKQQTIIKKRLTLLEHGLLEELGIEEITSNEFGQFTVHCKNRRLACKLELAFGSIEHHGGFKQYFFSWGKGKQLLY